jgi:3'-phosphoadenosine 5'-phosphosulfate sulfotransferase (PAPS reductase)/FAD synthetase
MKICKLCILPETFPGISFDADGVCNMCRKSEGSEVKLADDKKRHEQNFLDLLSSMHIGPESFEMTTAGSSRDPVNTSIKTSRSPYDILMAYSGGKDSTYTMILLKNKYKLRILAVSFDNGFISDTARTNIINVTESLGVDHIFFKPKWPLLKKIFTAAIDRELYSKKSLERASTICTSCIGMVKALCLKMAIEQEIPMIGFGWSPGQAPLSSAIMKNNPSLSRLNQQAMLNPMKSIVGDEIAAYFLAEKHFAEPDKFPVNVHPMAWEYYNENMILQEIGKYGWTPPRDTDSNSSNCLLNAFANDVHIKRYGFHPYVWEIANMVRHGVMDREEGYIKIYGEQPGHLVDFAKNKLTAS